MDSMLGDENNLKDTTKTLGITVKDTVVPVSYNKTNKLITALYMVTDIMDKDEPLRLKLRTSGTGIISDMHTYPAGVLPKISEIMSFLEIAGTVNLISDMNLNILRKEFLELKNAIEESTQIKKPVFAELDLTDLFKNEFSLPTPSVSSATLGVQKGSTLMQALGRVVSDKETMSIRNNMQTKVDFDVLKKERRFEIIKIIKDIPTGATITDIKTKYGPTLASCGEKTLQRELVSMVKDGVLRKEGSKRWSKYFLSVSSQSHVSSDLRRDLPTL